jgi:transcriptional regulator with XRE-family HTH domain
MATTEFDNELMRELRKARGITQAELAALTGLRQSMISRCENGTRNPSLTVRIAIATALGDDGLILKRVDATV